MFFFSQLRVLCTPHPRPSHQRCGHSLSSPWLLVIVCAGGGVSVVGQEQYSLGSQFSSSESYVGHIHSLNISDAVICYNYRGRLLLSVQAAGCWWWVRSRTLWAVSSAVLSPMWATSTASICGTIRYRQTRFSVWRRRVVTLATWWLGPTCWARSTDTSDCLTPPSAPVNLAYNTVRNFIKLSWILFLAFGALSLWRYWLGGRKGIWPVNWVVGCWQCYQSAARCRLAYGPTDAIATHCLFLQ